MPLTPDSKYLQLHMRKRAFRIQFNVYLIVSKPLIYVIKKKKQDLIVLLIP